MPHCDVIYILNEDMDERGHPDFNDERKNEFYNLDIKKENRNASGLDIFWEEYYNDDILRDKKLFNPLNKESFSFNSFTNPKRVFSADVEPNSFFLHTIPVRNFTPIYMLKFMLDSQQNGVDYIRNHHERYIIL